MKCITDDQAICMNKLMIGPSSVGANFWYTEYGPNTASLIGRGLVIMTTYLHPVYNVKCANFHITRLGHIALSCYYASRSVSIAV